MCLGPLFSVCSIVEECYCFVCFRSNKNLVKFIRLGIVQSNLILGGFLPTDHFIRFLELTGVPRFENLRCQKRQWMRRKGSGEQRRQR